MRCLESARLLSERRDHPLPLRKRVGLRVHLLFCVLCRTYQTQLVAMCRIALHAGSEPSSHAPGLPPEKKRAIEDAIRRS